MKLDFGRNCEYLKTECSQFCLKCLPCACGGEGCRAPTHESREQAALWSYGTFGEGGLHPPRTLRNAQKVNLNPSCITRLLPEPTSGLPATTSGVPQPQPNVLEVLMSLAPPGEPPAPFDAPHGLAMIG